MINKMISRSCSELKLMLDSYNGYPGCRVDYTPDDIDHIISDLLETKQAWKEELQKSKRGLHKLHNPLKVT